VNADARALLTGAIDYAGLFPPAALSLEQAKANYRRYRASPDAWALGRFVVPVAQLPELHEEVRREGWKLAVTLPAGYTGPLPESVDVVEIPARSEDEIRTLAARFRPALLYCEIDPAAHNLDELAAAAKLVGARAKLRTGGIRAEQIPASDLVLRFLDACRRHQLPFKATAGLHHALRGRYSLTYAPDSPTAVMHGYANLAAAVVDPAELACEDPAALERLLRTGAGARSLFVSFGSCSFEEPLQCITCR